jgi:hypothetical protein
MYNIQLSTTSDKEMQVGNRASLLLGAAGRAVISSQDAMEKGADLAKQLKALAKMAEEERVAIVKPFNDGVKAINERFKTMINPLLEAAKGIEHKMLTYKQEQDRIAREAQEAHRKAQEAEAARLAAEIAARQSHEPEIIFPVATSIAAPQVVAVPQITRGVMGSSASVRKTWTFEVLDIVALATARPDLVTTISAKINEEIRGKGGEIPGLRIYQQETMSVR